MKKLFTILSIVLLLTIAGNNKSYSQTGYNTVLEYCTGTWCQWCPCGHTIIDAILTNYPETVVLAYHGPPGNTTDPWDQYSSGMIPLFGFNAYPTGVVGRKSGIISRDAWNNQVVIQSNTIQPSVSLNLSAMNFNPGTRELTATVEVTALTTLTGEYRLNFVLTEDNLVYPQTGNSSCTGGASYVHDHVVKGMLNGDMGEVLNFSADNSATATLSYNIPAGFVAENCHLNILCWKNGGSMTTTNLIAQSKHTSVDNPTVIHNTSGNVTGYKLEQNYPNPFNPTTSIFFSVPKDGNVSLKFYDVLGNEVASYIDNGFLKAGSYNAEFDGSKLSSGVYFYTLSSNDFIATKKMILTK